MHPNSQFTPLERTRGEALLRRLTVWVGLGSMVATGAAAAVVAHAIPGRTVSHVSSGVASTSGSASGAGVTSPGASAGGVAPAPGTSVPAVTSGGS